LLKSFDVFSFRNCVGNLRFIVFYCFFFGLEKLEGVDAEATFSRQVSIFLIVDFICFVVLDIVSSFFKSFLQETCFRLTYYIFEVFIYGCTHADFLLRFQICKFYLWHLSVRVKSMMPHPSFSRVFFEKFCYLCRRFLNNLAFRSFTKIVISFQRQLCKLFF
jgi:hypothetical protein